MYFELRYIYELGVTIVNTIGCILRNSHVTDAKYGLDCITTKYKIRNGAITRGKLFEYLRSFNRVLTCSRFNLHKEGFS